MVDREARERIQTLEAQGVQRDREIADLSARLSRLAAMLEAIRTGRSAPAPAVPAVEELRSEMSMVKSPLQMPLSPPTARFASLIVSQFPALFAEFRGKRFTLLWRGSCDGFGVDDFHARCDGHANTLTLIEDTKGNIFGGFTPVEWESRQYDKKTSNCLKADPSLKSFLFTLKNPHNFPASKFALKAEKKAEAIGCDSQLGPCFCHGICVANNCNANTVSFTSYFGTSYANDTGLPGQTFFTGSWEFTVKEIEVFEITD
jgi:hypothetical protein